MPDPTTPPPAPLTAEELRAKADALDASLYSEGARRKRYVRCSGLSHNLQINLLHVDPDWAGYRAKQVMLCDCEKQRLIELCRSAAAMREELDRVKQSNTALHRRCQKAEAALPEWHTIQTTGFKGGNFGRALLVTALSAAQEERESLRARLERVEKAAAVVRKFLPAQTSLPKITTEIGLAVKEFDAALAADAKEST